jgi:hypothetical protein
MSIKSVLETFSSYNEILSNFFNGEATKSNKSKMPRYRTKGELAPVTYPSQVIQFDIETGQCRLPVSLEDETEVKELIGKKEIWINWINGCAGIKPSQVREVLIVPRTCTRDFHASDKIIIGGKNEN